MCWSLARFWRRGSAVPAPGYDEGNRKGNRTKDPLVYRCLRQMTNLAASGRLSGLVVGRASCEGVSTAAGPAKATVRTSNLSF